MKVIMREFYFSEKLKLFSNSVRSSYVNNIEYSFIATPNSNTIKKYSLLYDDLKLVYVSNVDEYELTFSYKIREIKTYSKFPKKDINTEEFVKIESEYDLLRKEAIEILISEDKKLTEFKIYRKIVGIKKRNEIIGLKEIRFLKWKKYSIEVRKLTMLRDIKSLENYDKRSYRDGYHLDHKISIYYGFKNNISVERISDISNLRFITGIENYRKNKKNFVDDSNKWILD